MSSQSLIDKANTVFLDNHKPETWFERAIFFSWYCGIRDCKFCYMSTQNTNRMARRTVESLLAEVVLCKQLGWKLGFISGGHKAYTTVEFEKVLEHLSSVAGEKLWINIGAISKADMKKYLPYAQGVVASIETINPGVHEFVCPSKPIEPFEEMFENAESLGLRKAMTIILGIGETIEDFELLKRFVKKHNVEKIHLYSLNPQKGTYFENAERPSAEYQAEWIARTRIAFSSMDIQAGIWLDCVDRVALLLRAGANSISKFPAIRYFNSSQARTVEEQAERAWRRFRGTLTRPPGKSVEKCLGILPSQLRDRTRDRLECYMKSIRKG